MIPELAEKWRYVQLSGGERVQQPGELDGNKFEEQSQSGGQLHNEVHKNCKPSSFIMYSNKYGS